VCFWVLGIMRIGYLYLSLGHYTNYKNNMMHTIRVQAIVSKENIMVIVRNTHFLANFLASSSA
jgi:hypothetical protein